jgi:glycosyltransferase involved in cell wall biosynthesis
VERILYIEANLDGTIGGSHYCLLEIVKRIDRNKYTPFVSFYRDNVLVSEFQKYCNVIVLNLTTGLIIKKDYPNLYIFSKKFFLSRWLLHLYQKTFNLIKYSLLFYLKIIYIIFKRKINLIHINNAPVLTPWLIAAKLFRRKCISHVRGNWEPTPLHKAFVKYYDSIISISNSVTNYVKNQGVNVDNFITIHDGIDIDDVLNMRKKNSDELRKELNVSNGNLLIGLIGNIKSWKGQHIAIEAVKNLKGKIPNIKCLIIGDVSNLEEDQQYYKYLKNLVNDHNLVKYIIFTGFRKDIPDIISILDILIHTSTAPEPFGRVILEGMVFSKPVIATAHGGPLEILEDDISGFLIPPNNPEALAKKIEQLISYPYNAKNVGQMGREKVKGCFSIETNVKKIEQLYTQLLST